MNRSLSFCLRLRAALRVILAAGVAGALFAALPGTCDAAADRTLKTTLAALEKKCAEYGWTDVQPSRIPWQYHRVTAQKRPLFFAVFGESNRNCTLFLGGVHGDELPSVYLMLKLADYAWRNPSFFKDKCVIIAPLVNPDGFFAKPPRRTNANGIDINRNFPTRDWHAKAHALWAKKTKRNRRYAPGRRPASEQETAFQIALIRRFSPRKILSVHSPLNIYDYDGPSSSLDAFAAWLDAISRETNHPMKRFGYFPGSLGNYAGNERHIFTLTLELPSSDPARGKSYFNQFQPTLIRFLDLRVS